MYTPQSDCEEVTSDTAPETEVRLPVGWNCKK